MSSTTFAVSVEYQTSVTTVRRTELCAPIAPYTTVPRLVCVRRIAKYYGSSTGSYAYFQ